MKQFGSSVSYENLRTIEGVFEEVGRGHVDYGLVPVENGSIGSVAETLDGFTTHCDRVAVCAEVQLSVAQALIAVPGAVPADIKFILSKPEAIGQCRRWLATQYPNAQLVPAASTSAAVEQVAKAYAERGEDARSMAAIGSRLAAQLHDLQVMFPEIQDSTPNITRFLALCSTTTASVAAAPSGDDKTSILFVCHDRPGALRDILDAFARANVNLTHIDKRPCPPPTLARLISVSSVGKGLVGNPTIPAAMAAVVAAGRETNDPLAPSLLVPTLLGGRGAPTLPFVCALRGSGGGGMPSRPQSHPLPPPIPLPRRVLCRGRGARQHRGGAARDCGLVRALRVLESGGQFPQGKAGTVRGGLRVEPSSPLASTRGERPPPLQRVIGAPQPAGAQPQ